LPITVLNCCWLPADLARHWLEAHRYRLPPYLEPRHAASPADGRARQRLPAGGQAKSAVSALLFSAARASAYGGEMLYSSRSIYICADSAIDHIAEVAANGDRNVAEQDFVRAAGDGAISVDGTAILGKHGPIPRSEWHTGSLKRWASGLALVSDDIISSGPYTDLRVRRSDVERLWRSRTMPPEGGKAAMQVAPARSSAKQHVSQKPPIPEHLRSAIERSISVRGCPGRDVPWGEFYTLVRSECNVSGKAPPRGYGDKSIWRAVKALEAMRGTAAASTEPG
jgi:hypothetical protein